MRRARFANTAGSTRIVVRVRKIPAGPAPHRAMKASRARPSDDEASAPTERDGHDHRSQARTRCGARQQRPGIGGADEPNVEAQQRFELGGGRRLGNHDDGVASEQPGRTRDAERVVVGGGGHDARPGGAAESASRAPRILNDPVGCTVSTFCRTRPPQPASSTSGVGAASVGARPGTGGGYLKRSRIARAVTP